MNIPALMRHVYKGYQAGGVALMLLVILGMVAVISGSTILYVDRQFNQTVQREQEEAAFHVAEAGVNVVIFGLNESIYNTEELANLGSLSGSVEGSGTYNLTLSRAPGSLPGQSIRVLAKGYDTTGDSCEGIDVVIHRTDQARQQFVPDQWDHLPSCDVFNLPGGTIAPPISCGMDSDCPSNSCNLATGQCDPVCTGDSECPSGECFELYGMCARECDEDSDCISNSCDIATGTCNICTGPGCPDPVPTPTPTATPIPTPTPPGGGGGGGGPTPTPQGCTTNNDCPSGHCSILPGDSTGVCSTSCNSNNDCPSGRCILGLCVDVCLADGDCESGSCDHLSQTCDPPCSDDSQCPAGNSCVNGGCQPFICLPDCQPIGYPTVGPCYLSPTLGSCVQLTIDVVEIPIQDPRPECQAVTSDTCYPVASLDSCNCPFPTPTPSFTPSPAPACIACGNALCEEGEDYQSCPDDCVESCGDGQCNEDPALCPDDCAAGGSCAEGCNNTADQCDDSCTATYDACAVGCGADLSCLANCQADLDSCRSGCDNDRDICLTGCVSAELCPTPDSTPPPPNECGDGVCTTEEYTTSPCLADCGSGICPDGFCAYPQEDASNCPGDCFGSPSPSMTLPPT